MKFKNKIALMITLIMVISSLNLISNYSHGKEITIFDNGGGQPTIEVWLNGTPGEGGGYCSDSTTYFSIPKHKGKIQEASLKVTCTADIDGRTLLNPRLDIGIDGDYEWEFTGSGYGSAGHQTLFSNNIDRRVVSIGKARTNNKTNIYLPKNAFVSDASMEIKGGNLEFGEVFIGVVNSMGDIYYIKSNKDGSFGSPQYVGSVGSNSYGIGIGDFDNDDDYDIVVNQGTWNPSNVGNIYLFKKTGPGNSFSKIINPVGTTGYYRNTDFAIGDFDNDNKLDFIESEQNQNFYFFKGDGNNNFVRSQITTSFAGGNGWGKDAADFNLDGNLDFVAGGNTGGSAYLFIGNGNGSFEKTSPAPSGTNQNTECVVSGDYNLDGYPDIIAKESGWSTSDFYFVGGNGDCTFQSPKNSDANLADWDITADGFDFDFDGNQDLITYDSANDIKCFWGLGNGIFTKTPDDLGSIPGSITGIATPPSAKLGGCDNLTIDFGEHGGLPDFSFSGPITDTKVLTGTLKDRLTDLLTNPPSHLRSFTDDYGNTLLEVPIRFNTTANGNILVQNLSIRYNYEAVVDENPNNLNLVNELNDLIPASGSGDFKVFFSIASDQPGKIKFSDLYVKFNEAPTTKTIPNVDLYEGENQRQLIQLSNYFYDDSELPDKLKYSVYSYTNEDYIDISIYNDVWLHVDTTASPDWFGESKIIVTAEDSGKGITRSNEFTVTINPVNDPPRIGIKLDNIDMMVNSIYDKIDFGDPNQYYFYDVDSPEMFYRAIIYDEEDTGAFDGYLELSIDNDTNILVVRSLNRNKKLIPLRIYCSDTESVRTLPVGDLAIIPTYQQLIINITSPGMDEVEIFPPTWNDIEDIYIIEDEMKIDWINLNNYTYDLDNSPESLLYSVESVENSAFMNVEITTSKDRTKNMLSIFPEPDFDGSALVTLRVEDNDHNYALEQFKVIMIPVADIPSITILLPLNNTNVSGIVPISGSAYDPENNLANVQVKIGDDPWLTIDGDDLDLSYWTFNWDSTSYTSTTTNVKIKARAIDADQSYSIFDEIIVKVNNLVLDHDNDNVPDIYDACPMDPLNWLDSDGDGIGDNTDDFPFEFTQWEDSDGDGYGDNSNGASPDQFPYDPTQWLDSDGDGLGDNPNGNNPDPNPKSPSGTGKGAGEEDGTTINIIWLTIIPFLALDILIFIYFFFIRKKKPNMKND